MTHPYSLASPSHRPFPPFPSSTSTLPKNPYRGDLLLSEPDAGHFAGALLPGHGAEMDGRIQPPTVAVLSAALVAVRRTKAQLSHHTVTEMPVGGGGGEGEGGITDRSKLDTVNGGSYDYM